jgi:phosphoribosylaminoimidazole (AIR) synthetase
MLPYPSYTIQRVMQTVVEELLQEKQAADGAAVSGETAELIEQVRKKEPSQAKPTPPSTC